jgi:FKBP-type peptidyl-prolyl cis-trans isomerase
MRLMKHSLMPQMRVSTLLFATLSMGLFACAGSSAPAREPGIDLTRPRPAHLENESAANVSDDESSLSAIFNAPKDEGLTWTDSVVGSGQSVQLGDNAKIHYIGRLADGTEFDNSHNRPGTFEFSLGRGMVIRGFERGMVGMKVGGTRRINVPWKLAYGVAGNPPRIPSKADLVFEIELLDILVPVPRTAPPKAGPSGVGVVQ